MGRVVLTPKKMIRKDIYRNILYRLFLKGNLSNVNFYDLLDKDSSNKSGLMAYYLKNLKQFGLVKNLEDKRGVCANYVITRKGMRLLKIYDQEMIIEEAYKNLSVNMELKK